MFRASKLVFPLVAAALLAPAAAFAQNTPSVAGAGQVQGAGQNNLPGAKNSRTGNGRNQGTGETKGSTAPRDYASGHENRLSPIAPAPAPPKVFARPRIGLALGGGGALALTEVGTLQWFEEHRIPVDVIAGTSMGCMVSALYSTGRTPLELTHVMNDKVFASVFSISQSYSSQSFRRRQDSREIPNGVVVGLRHGISFRNAVLQDQGLNAFLDREFLRYDDQTEFNTLPIPLRCVSTDVTDGRPAVFARGSIPDAVRASVSLPGVYKPFTMDGHDYVDGGVLENLPTPAIETMKPDVILAVSLPLEPINQSSLDSILSVLQRSFSVAIEGAERNQRKLATVVMEPDIKGFTANDYLRTVDLAKRGYAAAELNKAKLLPYALSESDWELYLAHRQSLRRPEAGPVLSVRVVAPTRAATRAVERLFAPLVNQPVDTARIEALLDQVRADGRFDADYTIGYESRGEFEAQKAGDVALPPGTTPVPVATRTTELAAGQPSGKAPRAGAPNPSTDTSKGDMLPGTDAKPDHQPGAETSPATPAPNDTKPLSNESLADIAARPILLVTVADRKTGPPFLRIGVNLDAQTTGITRATVEGILTDQDLGGYGAELRTHFKLGYLTDLGTEYFRPFNAVTSPERTVFFAPRADLLRQPFPIFNGAQVETAERQFQSLSVGGDLGLTNGRTTEIRAGIDFAQIRWDREIGTDTLPDVNGQTQRARVRYAFDNQDRALVPQFGVHATLEAAYLYDTVSSPNTPQVVGFANYAHRFRLFEPKESIDPATHQPTVHKGKQVFILQGEFGTDFNRDLAQPFRFTLGGVTRLAASALDEYRGTDYFFVSPALLRRIAELPAPLGQSIYLGAAYEFGQMRAPDQATINREDVVFGVVAETPLGVITAGPALGDHGERKFVFTLGKLF